MMCSVDRCERPTIARGLCTKHYQRWYNHGDPTFTHTSRGEDNETHLRHVGWAVTEDGCWEWAGSKFNNGYGCIRVGKQSLLVHRVAHEVWNGEIPEGLVVRHKCDNKPCMNPEHLEVGTQQDNINDRVARRGR